MLTKTSFFCLLLFGCASSHSAHSKDSYPDKEAPEERDLGSAGNGPSAEEAKQQRTRESIVLSNEAVDAFDHGDLDKAASLVTKATSLDPGNHNAWFNLGIVLDNQKKYQQSRLS